MFTGLSAFPLTPMQDDAVDEAAFACLVERLAASDVDSIAVLGSTGSYAYLSPGERRRVVQLAAANTGSKPLIVGVGALRTSEVLANVRAAEDSGAAGILLAPVSYQALTDGDVYGLFRDVTDATDLPVIIYDNPGTTHFTFSTELYGQIAALPGIASIKIPPVTAAAAAGRVSAVRAVIPDHVTIGISGDAAAADGLNAGCDAWYSAVAGTLPEPALAILRAAREGRPHDAAAESARLAPLWELFAEHGSLRVIAAVAEHLGFAPRNCLPRPLRGLDAEDRRRVAGVVDALGFTAG
ncbi:dihydrodipicolinate synthase family protein [Arthrobacter caoxuetaonis]|uniref:Dihydrodipicolinate synthase family protein n=1 Tax=Arthrobacter caoxuetaonis TaxID=2886935 RepID=A0A9X1MEV4_9MICC|nr:dihydrodipicolinate synthase family protein [Arthrobacter caoxuetaonis]MCC3298491.1 dihydrodipicolinate synthase family protein [Arthrobacter caoxuetaonis]USQ57238.1 dihydrodipicolinate synthase family protein [Arthrobacter caoxuetaonis]